MSLKKQFTTSYLAARRGERADKVVTLKYTLTFFNDAVSIARNDGKQVGDEQTQEVIDGLREALGIRMIDYGATHDFYGRIVPAPYQNAQWGGLLGYGPGRIREDDP